MVCDLEGQTRDLQAKLASSKNMAADLEKRAEGLEVALAKEEETAHLTEERAHSASEVACLEGWVQTLQV